RAPVHQLASDPGGGEDIDLLGHHLHVSRDLAREHYHRPRYPELPPDGAGHPHLAAHELRAAAHHRLGANGDAAPRHVDIAPDGAGDGDGAARRPPALLDHAPHHHRARAHDEIALHPVADGDEAASRDEISVDVGADG